MVYRARSQVVETHTACRSCILVIVKVSHFHYVLSLLAFALLVGVIADQSLCFSCPADLPEQSDHEGSAPEGGAELTCSICTSSLTCTSPSQPYTWLAGVAVALLVEKPYRHPIVDSIYHPPKH
jgi:hypothetical protein